MVSQFVIAESDVRHDAESEHDQAGSCQDREDYEDFLRLGKHERALELRREKDLPEKHDGSDQEPESDHPTRQAKWLFGFLLCHFSTRQCGRRRELICIREDVPLH